MQKLTKTTIAVKDLMMKRTMLSLVAVSIAAMSAFAAPYCGVEALPDLIKCLPAPPEPGSADFARDVARYEWGKEQRKDPERAALARHDSVWSYATVADAFSKPFGTEISPTNTPSTWKLIEDSLSTTDQMRVAPKAFYHRRRPFAYFNEEPLCPKEDGVWRDEGSYPSGHTMRSMVAALILAEINPAKADEIIVRAMQYGESRVIAGAHWQSDVDMTRIAAAIAYSRLHTLPAFLSQLELAKKEFAALRSGGRQLDSHRGGSDKYPYLSQQIAVLVATNTPICRSHPRGYACFTRRYLVLYIALRLGGSGCRRQQGFARTPFPQCQDRRVLNILLPSSAIVIASLLLSVQAFVCVLA